MTSVSMSGGTPLPAYKGNNDSKENGNEYTQLEFYCTRCHVMCNISDLLYGDHVNHSAIRKKEIVTYAPASLLHDTQLFAENVENNFIKPYTLQETEMTQSLHMLLKAQQQTECAIRELTQQLHTIQKSLYALCQNKLLHECNTCTLQQEYLREWQGLNDAKVKLEHILLHKTENQTSAVSGGDCNVSKNDEGNCINAENEEAEEHKTNHCTHSVESSNNNGNSLFANILRSTKVSEKLSGMNASQQLEHVSYILQSVKETLTCLNKCNNNDNYIDGDNDNNIINNNLWREWLESMLTEETILSKREKEEEWEHEKEKRQRQEDVQPANKNNSLLNRKCETESKYVNKENVLDDDYQLSNLKISTPPYSLLQQPTIKETQTEVPFSAATMANPAHSPTNGVSSVQVSRGVACSSISEHDSTQSCEWIAAEPPESSSSLHRVVESHLIESKEFDASFRSKCALSIAQHLEHEANKRINANAMKNAENGSTYQTTGNVITKEVIERFIKPPAPQDNELGIKRLSETYENVKRQEAELQAALEELKYMHDTTNNGDSVVQSDSNTSSLIELQYSLIEKQQKKQQQQIHQQHEERSHV